MLRTETRDFVLCSANVIELEEWAEAIHIAQAQLHEHELQQVGLGKLFMVVVGADDLMPSSIGAEGNMRPYCVAVLGKQKYETNVDEGGGW